VDTVGLKQILAVGFQKMTAGIPKDLRPNQDKSGQWAGLEIHEILVVGFTEVLK